MMGYIRGELNPPVGSKIGLCQDSPLCYAKEDKWRYQAATFIAQGMLLKDTTETYSSPANIDVDVQHRSSVHLSFTLYNEQQNKNRSCAPSSMTIPPPPPNAT